MFKRATENLLNKILYELNFYTVLISFPIHISVSTKRLIYMSS